MNECPIFLAVFVSLDSQLYQIETLEAVLCIIIYGGIASTCIDLEVDN